MLTFAQPFFCSPIGSSSQANLVELGQDAVVVSLYQVAYDRVAKVADLVPLDPLLHVLLLLQLERPVDEHLLQLLVGKVYDELLETVVLKGLEAVNIKNS